VRRRRAPSRTNTAGERQRRGHRRVRPGRSHHPSRRWHAGTGGFKVSMAGRTLTVISARLRATGPTICYVSGLRTMMGASLLCEQFTGRSCKDLQVVQKRRRHARCLIAHARLPAWLNVWATESRNSARTLHTIISRYCLHEAAMPEDVINVGAQIDWLDVFRAH